MFLMIVTCLCLVVGALTASYVTDIKTLVSCVSYVYVLLCTCTLYVTGLQITLVTNTKSLCTYDLYDLCHKLVCVCFIDLYVFVICFCLYIFSLDL